jgi:hypothetical protein
MNFSKDNKVVLAKAASAAATSAVNSDVIDMQGFEGVAFVGAIGTANAGNYAKVQQGAAANMSDAADLEGSKLVTGDDGDSFLSEIFRPKERYVRCVVTRGASTTIGEIYAILYGSKKKPVTHGSTIDAELHVSPDEGTA